MRAATDMIILIIYFLSSQIVGFFNVGLLAIYALPLSVKSGHINIRPDLSLTSIAVISSNSFNTKISSASLSGIEDG